MASESVAPAQCSIRSKPSVLSCAPMSDNSLNNAEVAQEETFPVTTQCESQLFKVISANPRNCRSGSSTGSTATESPRHTHASDPDCASTTTGDDCEFSSIGSPGEDFSSTADADSGSDDSSEPSDTSVGGRKLRRQPRSCLGATNDLSSLQASEPEACVYPLVVLLQLRAAAIASRHGATSALPRYSTRSFPDSSAAPFKPPCAAIEGSGVVRRADVSRPQATPSATITASAPWTPKLRRGAGTEDQVTRSIRALLNKLTVEKFDQIFLQLAAAGFSCSDHVVTFMHEVFDKATRQHHFIPMYAELCVRLEADPRVAGVVKGQASDGAAQHGFRRLLLNQCQAAFESLLATRQPDNAVQSPETTEDEEEAAARRKQQALGNVKLIGHLLSRGMLSSKLLVECSEALLGGHPTCPDALESLAALLTVAGPKFDTEAWQYYPRLQAIFDALAQLASGRGASPTPSRLRFLLRDVLEAREARRGGTDDAAAGAGCRAQQPMRLEEVRESAAAEAQAVAAAHRASATRPRISARAGQRGGPHEATPAPRAGERPQRQRQAPPAPQPKSAPAKEVTPPAAPTPAPAPVSAPPAEPEVPMAPAEFNSVAFHKELAAVLRELTASQNVAAAVRRLRMQRVPKECQAQEFADILTRTAEERRGPARRASFAFAAGLGAGAKAEGSAFERAECLAGLQLFFTDIYPDLCSEVTRLPTLVKQELVPTLASVFPASELQPVLPPMLSAAVA